MTKGRNSTRLNLRLQDEALDRLSALAAKSGQSVGTYARTLLERIAMAEQPETNPEQ